MTEDVKDTLEITTDQLKTMVKETVAEAIAAGQPKEVKQDKTFETFAIATRRVSDSDARAFIGNPEKDNLALGKLLTFAALMKNDHSKAMHLADKIYKDLPYFEKTLNSGDLASGGVLIDGPVASQIIEALRAKSVVRSLARNQQMREGEFRLARITSGAVARYKGENDKTNASQLVTDQINPTPHFLEALTAVSNPLNSFTLEASQRMAQDDLLEIIALREDKAFLRDDGTGFSPRGLINFAANTLNQTSEAVADVRTDFRALIEFVEGSNVPMTRPSFLMTSRSRGFLEDLKTAGGETNEFTIAMDRNLRGIPVVTTNNIPNNLGGGSNESEILLVDFDQIIIFDAIDSFKLTISNEATYKDALGQDRSAFAHDETIIKMSSAHDIQPRHPEAVASMKLVTYGA